MDVVLNPWMNNEKVATFLMQKLNDSPKKTKRVTCKKQLYKKLRNETDGRASEHSFDSKLDFFIL